MLITAFLTGFLGSLHCVGMCGPLAVAMPVPYGHRLPGALLYNLGRTATYAVLGLLFGSLGLSIKWAGVQTAFSIMLGVGILLLTVFPKVVSKLQSNYHRSDWMRWVKTNITGQFRKRTFVSAFITGILNGLLPCGLVYIAIAGSVISGSIFQGILYMLVFASGTLPAMLVLSYLPKLVISKSRFLKPKLITSFSLLLAFIFIYRGMTLEIEPLSQVLNSIGMSKITVCGN